MAKKLGDVAIALAVLFFIITGFSTFIADADSSLGVDSGIVNTGLNTFKNNLTDTQTSLESDLLNKVDVTSDVEADPDQQIENQGDDAGGLMNLVSKNIITKFLNSVSKEFPEAQPTITFLISLAGITITILLLRLWRGETKI